MPTFRHGRSASFTIDDSGGTPRDISSTCDSLDISMPVETAEVTAFGNNSKAYINGLRDSTVSISGHFDATATTGPDTVLGGVFGYNGGTSAGGSLTFTYGPEGTSSGRVKYTGECYMTSYQVSAPVGDKVSFSAEFQCTGDITRTTY